MGCYGFSIKLPRNKVKKECCGRRHAAARFYPLSFFLPVYDSQKKHGALHNKTPNASAEAKCHFQSREQSNRYGKAHKLRASELHTHGHIDAQCEAVVELKLSERSLEGSLHSCERGLLTQLVFFPRPSCTHPDT